MRNRKLPNLSQNFCGVDASVVPLPPDKHDAKKTNKKRRFHNRIEAVEALDTILKGLSMNLISGSTAGIRSPDFQQFFELLFSFLFCLSWFNNF